MTPKEKAKELVSKFTFLSYPESNNKFYNPKQCALIAVDELISTEYKTVSKLLEVIEKNRIRLVISLNEDYWQKVKQEIENL
jgi:hypothetical protein